LFFFFLLPRRGLYRRKREGDNPVGRLRIKIFLFARARFALSQLLLVDKSRAREKAKLDLVSASRATCLVPTYVIAFRESCLIQQPFLYESGRSLYDLQIFRRRDARHLFAADDQRLEKKRSPLSINPFADRRVAAVAQVRRTKNAMRRGERDSRNFQIKREQGVIVTPRSAAIKPREKREREHFSCRSSLWSARSPKAGPPGSRRSSTDDGVEMIAKP